MDEIRKLIQEAAEKARRETSHEPEPQFTGEVRYPVDCQVGKGLEGAIVTDTKVGSPSIRPSKKRPVSFSKGSSRLAPSSRRSRND
jgi:hypothetical protein